MDREITVSVDHVLEALRYLALPRKERIALAEAALSCTIAPPWLDDDVCAAVKSLGLTRSILLYRGDVQPGDAISTNGQGQRYRTELTVAGWEAIRTRVIPGALSADGTPIDQKGQH